MHQRVIRERSSQLSSGGLVLESDHVLNLTFINHAYLHIVWLRFETLLFNSYGSCTYIARRIQFDGINAIVLIYVL